MKASPSALLLALGILFTGTASAAPAPFAQHAQAAPTAATSARQKADTNPNGGTAVAPDEEAYLLGPGDKLRIEVYKEEQLSQSLQVRPDGKITLPLVGDMVASGLTSLELRDRISTSLSQYVNNPVVTVIVVEALASTVYVMGEVNEPGPLQLQGPMTVLQALAMAGGFKDFAKTDDIRILRRGAKGTETIRFNYKNAVRNPGEPIYLKRGDTVIVP